MPRLSWLPSLLAATCALAAIGAPALAAVEIFVSADTLPLSLVAAKEARRLLLSAAAGGPPLPISLRVLADGATDAAAACPAPGAHLLVFASDVAALAICAALKEQLQSLAFAASAAGWTAAFAESHAVLAAPAATNKTATFLVLGGAASSLHGVYTWARAALGAAFTLGAEHVPVRPGAVGAVLAAAAAALGARPLLQTPRFAERGLFPWHDFTMGPDWLDTPAWHEYVHSLATLRFNTLMLHQYNADDHRHYGTQPIAWFGLAEDVLPGGRVARAYPAWQMTNMDALDYPAGQAAAAPRPTSQFDGGAGALFPADCFGSPLQTGRGDRCPRPADPAALLSAFEEAAPFFNASVWAPARALGLRVAVAVGSPLSVPAPAGAAYVPVRDAYCSGLPFDYTGSDASAAACGARAAAMQALCYDFGVPPPGPPPQPNGFPCRISLISNGTAASTWNYTAFPRTDNGNSGGSASDAAVAAAYAGTLTRLAAVYAGGADTLVVWAQIQSTQANFDNVARELALAQAAIDTLPPGAGGGATRLASGGWALGPAANLTFLDGAAAPNVTLTALLGGEGQEDVPPAFGQLRRHGAWTVPWLESDEALLSPQLFVARTLRQAEQAAAAAPAVVGNLAIHWRVTPCAPAATALALAGWTANVTVLDVYTEWASAAFGLDAGDPALAAVAAAFAALDGNGTLAAAPLPPLDFAPGWAVMADDAAVAAAYAFVDASLAPMRPRVAGVPKAARALEYWVGVFRMAAAVQRAKLRFREWGPVQAAIEAAPAGERAGLAATVGLPALAALSSNYSAALAPLLASSLGSYGDLGVLSDLNTGTHGAAIAPAAAFLAQFIAVPPAALPARDFAGPPRAFAPNAARAVFGAGDFTVDVWVVAAPVDVLAAAARLCVAPAAAEEGGGGGGGGWAWSCTPMNRTSTQGSVFRGAAPPPAAAFVAYAAVQLAGGQELLLPDGAPATGCVWSVAVV